MPGHRKGVTEGGGGGGREGGGGGGGGGGGAIHKVGWAFRTSQKYQAKGLANKWCLVSTRRALAGHSLRAAPWLVLLSSRTDSEGIVGTLLLMF